MALVGSGPPPGERIPKNCRGLRHKNPAPGSSPPRFRDNSPEPAASATLGGSHCLTAAQDPSPKPPACHRKRVVTFSSSRPLRGCRRSRGLRPRPVVRHLRPSQAALRLSTPVPPPPSPSLFLPSPRHRLLSVKRLISLFAEQHPPGEPAFRDGRGSFSIK